MGDFGISAGIQAVSDMNKSILAAYMQNKLSKEQRKPLPVYAPASAEEKEFRRGLRDLFGAATGVTGAGVGQLAMIMPEIYRQLGYEPTIIDRTADAAAAQEEVNAINERVADLQARKAEARRGPASEAKNKKLAKLKKQLKLTKKDLADKQRTLTDLQSQPIQITGLSPIPADQIPKTGTQQMVDLTTQQAIEALQGKVETDPTLMRQFDEEEGKLREKLRRQLGPGYETSSAGIQALADFSKRKTEGIASYTRDLAASLSERALGGESVLSDLLSARLNQLVFPSGQTQAAGLRLGSLIEPGLGIQGLLQREREQTYSGAGGASAMSWGRLAGAGTAATGELALGVADWLKNRNSATTPSYGGLQETWTSKGAPLGAVMG